MSDGLSEMYDNYDVYRELCEKFKEKPLGFCNIEWLDQYRGLLDKSLEKSKKEILGIIENK
jgi:hypothetical protein